VHEVDPQRVATQPLQAPRKTGENGEQPPATGIIVVAEKDPEEEQAKPGNQGKVVQRVKPGWGNAKGEQPRRGGGEVVYVGSRNEEGDGGGERGPSGSCEGEGEERAERQEVDDAEHDIAVVGVDPGYDCDEEGDESQGEKTAKGLGRKGNAFAPRGGAAERKGDAGHDDHGRGSEPLEDEVGAGIGFQGGETKEAEVKEEVEQHHGQDADATQGINLFNAGRGGHGHQIVRASNWLPQHRGTRTSLPHFPQRKRFSSSTMSLLQQAGIFSEVSQISHLAKAMEEERRKRNKKGNGGCTV